MRNLKTPTGADVVAEPAFAALRDRRPTTVAAVEERRVALERDVFAVLDQHGIDRASLVLAFDFVIQSDHQLTHQNGRAQDVAGG